MFLAVSAVSMLLLGGCFDSGGSNSPKFVINTGKGEVEYSMEIADSFEERKEGLMFRTNLPEKHGMFFVFEKPQQLTFWMKNTLIPLDMIFLDANYKVAHIEKNTQPCKVADCPVYKSVKNAQYVLEVNAGESDKFGVKEGDQADIST
jgi:uncharacterized membrane protein (UPF0127 family)